MVNPKLSINLDEQAELLAQFSKQDSCQHGKLDLVAIRRSWSEMRSALDLNDLLINYQASRLDLYRVIGIDYAVQIEKDAIYDILKGVIEHNIPILMSTGNQAVIQTYQGSNFQVISKGNWISIVDGESSVHLQEDLIHSAWIVNKPSMGGMLSSLELFDQSGGVVALFYGVEDEGLSQCKWRKLLIQISAQSCI